MQSAVTNYTLQDSLYRIRCPVGVSYGSDMAEVQRVLEEVADGITLRSKARVPVVLLTAFGNSSVDFEVSIWIEDPWTVRGAKSELHFAIWWGLKRAGITIAFPQVDVHFDEPLRRQGGPVMDPTPPYSRKISEEVLTKIPVPIVLPCPGAFIHKSLKKSALSSQSYSTIPSQYYFAIKSHKPLNS